jgi:hypothetical protein
VENQDQPCGLIFHSHTQEEKRWLRRQDTIDKAPVGAALLKARPKFKSRTE